MEKVLKRGLMVLVIEVIMWKVKSMELDNLPGLMGPLILANSTKTILKAKEFMNGPMVEDTRESGKTTRWKEAVFSPGLMEEDMKENMLMTRRKAMVCSTGPMEESMTENGSMESSTVSASTLPLLAKPRKENGMMERGLDGLSECMSLEIELINLARYVKGTILMISKRKLPLSILIVSMN